MLIDEFSFQEFYKLLVIDLVTAIVGILVIDFIRSLFVRYMNPCWCWDLEKTFVSFSICFVFTVDETILLMWFCFFQPEYGEFKVAENILHIIYNQFVVW